MSAARPMTRREIHDLLLRGDHRLGTCRYCDAARRRARIHEGLTWLAFLATIVVFVVLVYLAAPSV